MADKQLTPQKEAFAQAVGSGQMTQSDAYRQAYPASKKWKDDSVHNKSSALMRDAQVKARVKQIQEVGAVKAGIVAGDILEELKRIALSDISGIIDKATGKVLLPHELDPATRAAVASFKIDEYGRIEYKFWDKNSAIDKAMKHKGLFEVDNKQKTDPLAEVLKGLGGNVAGVVKDAP